MKITYVCADLGISFDGLKGASAHVRGFVRALSSLGHTVTLVMSDPDSRGEPVSDPQTVKRIAIERPVFLEHLSRSNVRIERALRHISNNSYLERALAEAVNKERPDVIYERYSPFISAGAVLARLRGIPHLLEVNSLLSEEGRQFRMQALQDASEYLEANALQATNRIIAVSEGLKQTLLRRGVPAEKIDVVPNGFDDFLFRPRDNARTQSPERFVIGFVGSLKPWHDIPLLLSSFRLLAVDPRFHLLIVGDGPMRKNVEEFANEFRDRVTIAGGVPHASIPEYLALMDVAAAPYPAMDSFYFSPLKLFEYMAAGLPVVASGVGQVREVIRDGENGLLARPGDIEGFAQACRRLLDSPHLRDRIGRTAAQEAHQSYSWRRRVMQIFKSLALENNPASSFQMLASPNT